MHMFTPVNVMTVYERVTRRHAISQNEFVTYFNETVGELENTYGGAYVLLPEVIFAESIVSIDGEVSVDGRYTNAITDNILYLATGAADYKNAYQSHAQDAYLDRWREENKHKRIKGDVRK